MEMTCESMNREFQKQLFALRRRVPNVSSLDDIIYPMKLHYRTSTGFSIHKERRPVNHRDGFHTADRETSAMPVVSVEIIGDRIH